MRFETGGGKLEAQEQRSWWQGVKMGKMYLRYGGGEGGADGVGDPSTIRGVGSEMRASEAVKFRILVVSRIHTRL